MIRLRLCRSSFRSVRNWRSLPDRAPTELNQQRKRMNLLQRRKSILQRTLLTRKLSTKRWKQFNAAKFLAQTTNVIARFLLQYLLVRPAVTAHLGQTWTRSCDAVWRQRNQSPRPWFPVLWLELVNKVDKAVLFRLRSTRLLHLHCPSSKSAVQSFPDIPAITATRKTNQFRLTRWPILPLLVVVICVRRDWILQKNHRCFHWLWRNPIVVQTQQLMSSITQLKRRRNRPKRPKLQKMWPLSEFFVRATLRQLPLNLAVVYKLPLQLVTQPWWLLRRKSCRKPASSGRGAPTIPAFRPWRQKCWNLDKPRPAAGQILSENETLAKQLNEESNQLHKLNNNVYRTITSFAQGRLHLILAAIINLINLSHLQLSFGRNFKYYLVIFLLLIIWMIMSLNFFYSYDNFYYLIEFPVQNKSQITSETAEQN